MKKILIMVLLCLVLVGCKSDNRTKFDEVIYDCGSHLIKGTEVDITQWDIEDGVEVYYLYDDNYSINYNYPMREWFENFNAVVLNDYCKEILRFYNYSTIIRE